MAQNDVGAVVEWLERWDHAATMNRVKSNLIQKCALGWMSAQGRILRKTKQKNTSHE
jgi:hypothetical protein